VSAPARDPLLEAGFRLAERVPFAEARPEMIAAEAGLPADALGSRYVDFEHYLIALQESFANDMREFVTAATANHAAGFARLRQGAIAYLDECLRHRGVRGWILAARHQIASVAEGSRRMNETFTLGMSVEFHAERWPHPLAAAHIFLAIAQETSRHEHIARGVLPEMREALFEFLKIYEKAGRRVRA
jgi:hypothetical protein